MWIFKTGCLYQVLPTIYIRSVAWFYDAPVLLSSGQNYCVIQYSIFAISYYKEKLEFISYTILHFRRIV